MPFFRTSRYPSTSYRQITERFFMHLRIFSMKTHIAISLSLISNKLFNLNAQNESPPTFSFLSFLIAYRPTKARENFPDSRRVLSSLAMLLNILEDKINIRFSRKSSKEFFCSPNIWSVNSDRSTSRLHLRNWSMFHFCRERGRKRIVIAMTPIDAHSIRRLCSRINGENPRWLDIEHARIVHFTESNAYRTISIFHALTWAQQW